MSSRLIVSFLVAVLLAPASGRAGEPGTTPAEEDAAEVAPDPDELVLTLDGAIERAISGNHQVRLDRDALASSQSSLRAAENQFDFKLATEFRNSHDYIQDRLYGAPPLTYRDSLVNDRQDLTFTLSRPVQWGATFDVTTSFYRTHDEDVLLLRDPLHESTAQLSYTQPLLRGRGRRYATAGLETSRTQYEDQRRSLSEQETRLVVDVTGAFFGVVRSEKLIDINQQAMDQARDRLETAQLRLNEGLITPIEVSRADRDLKQRESSLIDAKQTAQAARDDFMLVLGLPLSTPFRVVSTEVFEPIELDESTALDEARRQRADLANAQDALKLATLSAAVARQDKQPVLDLTLSAGLTNVAGTEASKFFDVNPENAWTGSMVFSHVFGERSDDESLVQALISEDAAKIALERTELEVARQVRNALRQIRRLENQVAVLDENRKLAAESLRLSTLQFEEGLISTSDLTVDQATAVQAETDYVNALYDHAVSRAALELVLGRYRAPSEAHRSPWLRPEEKKP